MSNLISKHNTPRILLCILIFLTSPLYSAPWVKATRNPLNIIPTPIKTVTTSKRQNQIKQLNSQILPQLTPTTRTLHHPIKSLTALSGIVEIGSLGHVEESTIGLIDGLGKNLWHQSRSSHIYPLFEQIPTQFHMPAVKKLAEDMILTRASPPLRLTYEESFFSKRLSYLLKLGNIKAVTQLIKLTRAEQHDVAIAQISAELALIQGHIADACGKIGLLSRLSPPIKRKNFTLKLRGYCQIKINDMTTANLTLNLAQEVDIQDSLYLNLLLSLMTHDKPERPLQKIHKPFTILQALMIYDTGIHLKSDEITLIPQSLLGQFLEYSQYDLEIQLLLIEQSIMTRHKGYNLLREASQLIDSFASSQLENNTSLPSSWKKKQVISRAILLRDLNEPVTLQGRMVAIRDLLYKAQQQNVWTIFVEIISDELRQLNPTLETARFADIAIPALLWLGENDKASLWMNTLLEQQAHLPTALSRNLEGLMRLSTYQPTPHTQTALENIQKLSPKEAILIGANFKTGKPIDVNYTHYELALLPLFNYHIPDFLRISSQPSPISPKIEKWLNHMDKALTTQKRGEVILYALMAIGYQQDTKHYDSHSMQRILSAIKNIGLETYAHAIARDLLIIQAAKLSKQSL